MHQLRTNRQLLKIQIASPNHPSDAQRYVTPFKSLAWHDSSSTLRWVHLIKYSSSEEVHRSKQTMLDEKFTSPFFRTVYPLSNSRSCYTVASFSTLTTAIHGQPKLEGNTATRLVTCLTLQSSQAHKRSDWNGAICKLGPAIRSSFTITNSNRPGFGKEWLDRAS